MGAYLSREEEAPDHYTLLEVSEDASQDDIKVRVPRLQHFFADTAHKPVLQRSFRRLALIHHPDKNKDDTEAATKRFAELQEAYGVSECSPGACSSHSLTHAK